jgi:glycosyltransferase involved in cell wall biosynthesis
MNMKTVEEAKSKAPATKKHTITEPRIAVLVPCYNEELTIGKVIASFRAELPGADIYVFDNNSSDASAKIAREHGAHVIPVRRQGKGNVVRAMLTRVDADAYVMVDADDTYPAHKVHCLLQPVLDGKVDMAVGARLQIHEDGAFRPLHEVGNHLFCWLVNLIFGASLKDVLSGYRAFNGAVAKALPIVSSGFEVEAEMTIQCLYYDFTIEEFDVPYQTRPAGSTSKLNTFRDGARILGKIIHLLRAYKPLTFFGSLGIVSLFVAVDLGTASGWTAPALTGSATIASVLRDILVLFGGVFTSTGIILHTINYRIKEVYSVLAKEEVPRH